LGCRGPKDEVPVGKDHGEGQVVGVAVHVYPQDPVRLGVDRRGKGFAPGEVGVDLPVLEGELRVVGEPRVNSLQEGFELGVGGLHQGVGVLLLGPQVHPGPQGAVPDLNAEIGVAPLALLFLAKEEPLALFLPAALEGFQGLPREVLPLQLLKEPPSPEDHLLGVVPELQGGVQDRFGLFRRSVGPLELFPGLPLQKAVVGEPRGAGEAAHEVQDRLRFGAPFPHRNRGHSWFHFAPFCLFRRPP